MIQISCITFLVTMGLTGLEVENAIIIGFFAGIINLVILFYTPIFINSEEKIIMKDLQYPSLLLLLSTLLALFAIFQFKTD